jgi:hypothetical protein
MKKPTSTTEVTMREFRTAPAKILRRAARTKTRLRIGDFVLAVEETPAAKSAVSLHGCMRDTGRVVGSRSDLLSARDRWATDE